MNTRLFLSDVEKQKAASRAVHRQPGNESSTINTNSERLGTSERSAKESRNLASCLRERIVDLAQKAGTKGISINAAERLIEDHKGHSVSPRFAELIRRGALVRIPIEPGRPTKRFPHGAPRYITRYDEQTGRKVNVHWVPEFALMSAGKYDPDHLDSRDHKSDAPNVTSQKSGGARV